MRPHSIFSKRLPQALSEPAVLVASEQRTNSDQSRSVAEFWTGVKENRMMVKRRRVLIVSFDYPPLRTSAVHRMTAMTRFVAEHGWEPTVLTVDEDRGHFEPALMQKLPPEARIVRTPYLRIAGWEDSTAAAIKKAGMLQPSSNGRSPRRIDRWLRHAAAILRSTLYFPDETAGWVPFALAEALRLHMERPFDVVYTTTPPRAAPLVGLLMKNLCRVPWVSEFMDPWYPQVGPWYPAHTRLRLWADARLHSHLMHSADKVVVMMQGHADELMQQEGLPAEKFAVVRNGFWEEDFAALEDTPTDALPPGYIHLSHFGTVYRGNEGEFFEALADLVRECPDLKSRLRLNIVGYPHEGIIRSIRGSVLNDIAEIRGFVEDRSQILRMMRSSDFLMVFWGRPEHSRQAIAGKTYDYLRVGRPILAVTRPGGVQQLVEGAEAGWVLPPDEPARIKEMLRTILSKYQKSNVPPRPRRPEFVAQFRWDCQGAKLARIFDETVANVC